MATASSSSQVVVLSALIIATGRRLLALNYKILINAPKTLKSDF